MKISVIIPVFNGENFIQTSVDSALKQSLPKFDYEIIVVNDGSTDNTTLVIKEIMKDNPNIVLINQENGGVSKARNVGIKAASGEYITFLDSDDELHEQALETMLKHIQENNADICAAQDPSDTSSSETKLYTHEECIRLCIEDNPLIYSSVGKLYKTEMLKKNNILFPEGKEAHEDSYFLFQCFYNGMNMTMFYQTVYFVHTRSNSLSKKPFSSKKLAIIELANQKYDLINEKFSQFKSISPNLLIKAHMALLSQMKGAKEYKKLEKESILFICKNKKYFIPATEYDKKFFFIITHHLYGLYKLIKK